MIDAVGLMCPEPVFRARRALDALRSGQELELRADDPLAGLDLEVFCQRHGHSLRQIADLEGGVRVFKIRKR
ncbi:MAG: sulfurtransferase TusA family protein [Wenzhouxiangellaceae bacterium]